MKRAKQRRRERPRLNLEEFAWRLIESTAEYKQWETQAQADYIEALIYGTGPFAEAFPAVPLQEI